MRVTWSFFFPSFGGLVATRLFHVKLQGTKKNKKLQEIIWWPPCLQGKKKNNLVTKSTLGI
jgi:hypothetical protein